MSLKEYQIKVRELAEAKGYNQELFYMFSHMIQEASELLDAIWQGKSDKEVEEECADVLHFLFQMMDKRPNADVDRGMNNKIASNFVHKKKTLAPDGSMIKK